ncbi:MAG TPA: hypothetical protein VFT55_06980 [Planctomycetota bacterium]|nr:hypothetical protein [Planctomycetota bacterium]
MANVTPDHSFERDGRTIRCPDQLPKVHKRSERLDAAPRSCRIATVGAARVAQAGRT